MAISETLAKTHKTTVPTTDPMMKKLHPFTALTIWAIVAVQALLLPLGISLIILALSTVLCLIAWQPSRYRLRYVLLLMIPMALGFWLVHGGLLHSWLGNEINPKAQQHAMTIWWRLLAIFTAAQIWMQYVPTITMIQALFASRLPIGLSYLLASPLLLMQQLSNQIKHIQEAQLARGVRLDGNLFQRAKAMLAIIFPLINSTFANLSIKIAALESKGFRYQKKRSNIWAPKDSHAQKYFRYLAIALLIMESSGVLLWRL